MEVRLQKFLADAGVASRRKAEELILAGKIQVNGVTVTELGTKVDNETDEVYYNGKRVKGAGKHVYIMLNKPEGFVTTVKDQFDRPTVMDLIKGVKERVVPVGRLDYDTSGLLLLTNDGELTYKLTHPSKQVEKTYIAKLFGRPDENNIREFSYGVKIDTGLTQPAKLEILEDLGKYCVCKITITEGKNRQVRKMCDAIKHPVATLKRVGTGNIELGDLKKGAYRYLTDREVAYLKSL
ncbi:rRNA pseudouridine synthase [Lachnospiraceae bacterium NSJ-143]|nr:rRNA pseudouridine synthase [Lachnospiraceae bacterium NSJ-143]